MSPVGSLEDVQSWKFDNCQVDLLFQYLLETNDGFLGRVPSCDNFTSECPAVFWAPNPPRLKLVARRYFWELSPILLSLTQ